MKNGDKKKPAILVLYYSQSGNVRNMAIAVEEGARGAGAETKLIDVKDATVDQLLDYDGIIVGSPTYYGVIAGVLKEFFDRSYKHHGKLAGKVGGAFSSAYAMGGGMETTVMNIIQILLVHSMIVQGQLDGNYFGVVSAGAPSKEVLEQCRKLGENVSLLASRLL